MKTPPKAYPSAVGGYTPPATHRDWQGQQQPITRPKGEVIAADPRGPVELIRQSKDRFAAVYGLQCKRDLSRDAAAAEYGHCIFHLCECQGLI